jgi:hypothetical protein
MPGPIVVPFYIQALTSDFNPQRVAQNPSRITERGLP